MTFKVFYAWQSDTKSSLNRSFIEDAARKALKAIKEDLELEDSPRLDQATQDEAGMCEIATTILRKIDEATIFLADLTLVGRIDPCARNTRAGTESLSLVMERLERYACENGRNQDIARLRSTTCP